MGYYPIMITIEEYLHQQIKNHSGSIKAFCSKTDLPYMTVNNVIKRGVVNSSLNTLQKICDGLNTSLPLLLIGYKVLTDDCISAQEVQEFLQASAIATQAYLKNPSKSEIDDNLISSYFSSLFKMMFKSDIISLNQMQHLEDYIIYCITKRVSE